MRNRQQLFTFYTVQQMHTRSFTNTQFLKIGLTHKNSPQWSRQLSQRALRGRVRARLTGALPKGGKMRGVATNVYLWKTSGKPKETGQKENSKFGSCICHTLISSGDLCLMTCDLCLVLMRCLAPIIRQFVKFRDMPENKRKYWCTIHKVPWHPGNQMEASLHN